MTARATAVACLLTVRFQEAVRQIEAVHSGGAPKRPGIEAAWHLASHAP